MVLKEMHIHENLSMDNHHAPTTFTTRRGYVFTWPTLFLLGAFFICTLVAVSFIIYNFATCDQLAVSEGEKVVCTTIHGKYSPTTINDANRKSRYDRDVRLPRAIKPLKYNISLVPHLQKRNFQFEGQVKIRILVLEDCYNITLHASELNISKSDIAVRRVMPNSTFESGDGLRIRKQYLLEVKQFFIMEFYDKLIRDSEYEISLSFCGLIQDFLQGFYRSSYYVGNETRWLASTQFQATDARRAFPCFDEPALKSNFTLNIARPTNLSTVSNMPILATIKHETLPNYVWDQFEESLPMSTYLVAYAITDFHHLSVKSFSVWARASAIQSAQYALNVGPRILEFLEKYFDIGFPLPKMDMIALPDFQAGAMENWGLITFRETTMLYEEGVSPTTTKQRIALVVGHELAHQWFGNLVTPSWWSEIWLNEGFASYMEYLTVNAVEPKWKTLDQFVVNELQNVFQLDALSTSHKISVEVFNPEEISEIFDRISYSKGSTIIRMMNHFLTDKVFRRGLSKYLRDKAYSSADQDDLWHFLTVEATASGLLDKSTTVKEIMDTWTLQVGYPVLKISCHPNTHIIRLNQERFVFLNSTRSNETTLWWIPITYTSSRDLDFENTRPATWIPRTEFYEIEDHNLSTADWYIFNIQQTGYYRVNYDLENWKAVIDHLMKPTHYREIAPVNRAQLIDDSMNLARAGYLSYNVALNLSRYLIHEVEHVPWKAAVTAFKFIDSMLVVQGDYSLLKSYLLKLLTNIYEDVSFENDVANQEDMLKLLKQVEILNMACHLGHRHCIAESSRHFQNWIQDPIPDANNPISPNLRAIIYCTAIQYGTEFEWNFAFERYLKSRVSTERDLLLTALGCSREPWILSRYLRRSIVGDFIRKQDVYRIFVAVSNNVVGQHISFDFIRNNWREIKAYLGSSSMNLITIVKFATKNMNSKFILAELESFVKNEMQEDGRTIRQLIEQVQVNVDWMRRNYKPIVDWLRQEIPSVEELPKSLN